MTTKLKGKQKVSARKEHNTEIKQQQAVFKQKFFPKKEKQCGTGYKSKNGKLTKNSMMLYLTQYANDLDPHCVYGQAILDNVPTSEQNAKTQLLDGRVSEGVGKHAAYLISTRKLEIAHAIDITTIAKKMKMFFHGSKIDQHLISMVCEEEIRGRNLKNNGFAEYVTITADELHGRIISFIDSFLGDDSEWNEYEDSIKEFVAKELTPRCDDNVNDIKKFKHDFHIWLHSEGIDPDNIDYVKYAKLSGHFIQIWACGAGKSTCPTLVYDACFRDLYDYTTGNPINLGAYDSVKNLSASAQKMAGHDQALNRNTMHFVLTGAFMQGKERRELDMLASSGVSNIICISDRSQFKRLVEEYTQTHTIWIHTVYNSYHSYRWIKDPVTNIKSKRAAMNCLTSLMRNIGREFYFAIIDEYHRTIQHPDQPFAAIHNDNICRIQFRYKCSASKPKTKGTSKKESLRLKKYFHLDKYNDVIFTPLSINEAYARGYIRNYKVWDLMISEEILRTFIGKSDIVEVLVDGKNPRIGVKDSIGNEINAPLEYYAKALAVLTAKFQGLPINYTLGVTNQIDHANRFREFFVAVRPIIVEWLCDGDKDHPMYNRLMKMHIDVMDTKEKKSTKEIFERIDEIPTLYEDAIIIHCYVAETGWNPGDTLEYKNVKLWEKHQGFIDSVMFIDNISSAQRIQQNCGRGCRAPHLSNTCYVVSAHVENKEFIENPFNKRFKFVNKVVEALEIGEAEIQDTIKFYDFAKFTDSGPGEGKQKGQLWPTAMFSIVPGSLSGVDAKYLTYIEHGGMYSPVMEWLDDFCLRWIELDKQKHGYLVRSTSASIFRQVLKELYAKHPETKDYHKKTIRYYLRGWGMGQHMLSDTVYETITEYLTVGRDSLKATAEADIKNLVNKGISKEIELLKGPTFKLIKSKYNISHYTIKDIASKELDIWENNTQYWKDQNQNIYQFIYDYVIDEKNIGFTNNLVYNSIKKSGLPLGSKETQNGIITTRVREIEEGKIFSKAMTKLFKSHLKEKRAQHRRENPNGALAMAGDRTGENNKNFRGWIIGTPIDPSKETIRSAGIQTDILKKLNISASGISNCITGRNLTHKGYTWTREEQDA